jgi:hypothetical protein
MASAPLEMPSSRTPQFRLGDNVIIVNPGVDKGKYGMVIPVIGQSGDLPLRRPACGWDCRKDTSVLRSISFYGSLHDEAEAPDMYRCDRAPVLKQ